MCDRCAPKKGMTVPLGVCEEKQALGVCPLVPPRSFLTTETPKKPAPKSSSPSETPHAAYGETSDKDSLCFDEAGLVLMSD